MLYVSHFFEWNFSSSNQVTGNLQRSSQFFIGDSIFKTFRWSNYQTFSTNNFTTTKWRKDSDKQQNVLPLVICSELRPWRYIHWMILMVWIFLTLYEHFKGTKFSKERVTNNKIVFIAMILPNIKKQSPWAVLKKIILKSCATFVWIRLFTVKLWLT